jgi:hypothetical protein
MKQLKLGLFVVRIHQSVVIDNVVSVPVLPQCALSLLFSVQVLELVEQNWDEEEERNGGRHAGVNARRHELTATQTVNSPA